MSLPPSALPRLPLTVVGGYLGAGKTTLINRLLREDHGQRVLVMVNDFGAINIDADLLVSADGDTMTLTNGCVCCTMGADLFMAMGDALDRRPRPDHLVIEASGIADPARIAAAARAEPDLAYGGIAVVVDALHWLALADDPQIGAQIRGQVATADLLLISKAEGGVPPVLSARLAALSAAPQIDLADDAAVAPLLLGGLSPLQGKPEGGAHPAYLGWAHEGDEVMTRESLAGKLSQAPQALYRIKGLVCAPEGPGWEVQVVGRSAEIKPALDAVARTRLVALGPQAGITRDQVARWWSGC
ncbi:CobW family GTP-binding protein [Seohaeicola saemankumensis]|uniref:CobW family GTP-binding protein n=1 Tax=Seohaeicola saemankumensis TaxID=481181 RepID=A0ABW3TE86_9RHOB